MSPVNIIANISPTLHKSQDKSGHEWNLRSDGDGRVIKTRGAADRRKKPPLSVVPTIVAVAITAATRLMDGCEHQMR